MPQTVLGVAESEKLRSPPVRMIDSPPGPMLPRPAHDLALRVRSRRPYGRPTVREQWVGSLSFAACRGR